MKVKSLFIEGNEKYVNEIIEEVRARLCKGCIWRVEINPQFAISEDSK